MPTNYIWNVQPDNETTKNTTTKLLSKVRKDGGTNVHLPDGRLARGTKLREADKLTIIGHGTPGVHGRGMTLGGSHLGDLRQWSSGTDFRKFRK